MNIRILGSGFYGCHLAIALLRDGHNVQVHEIADRMFAGASGSIPARIHRGFHYPRSASTREACNEHYTEFMEHYGVPVNIAKLSKQRKEDPRDDKKDDAFKALRKIAYEYAKENGEAENVEENDYNDQETIEQNIGFVSGNNRSIAAHKFGKKSIDSLIAQIPNETLENLVANEDPENPLSDDKIALILQDSDLQIARRTVAKYRKVLNILPSNKRKQL